MVGFFEAFVLGLVQGVTEWLPVSSSGHLVLVQNFFGISEPVVFDVVLHLASLLVILFVFWKDIVKLVSGLLSFEKSSVRFFLMLVLASVPVAFVGFFFNDFIKSIFNNNYTVGVSLLVTSALLFLSKYPRLKNKSLNFVNSFVVGVAQAAAILPGISRSGATISSGLMMGVKKEEVAKFSFLLFIPAIVGAGLFEINSISEVSNFSVLFVAFLTALVFGFLSLKLLLSLIKKGKFHYFAWYCLFLGLIVLINPF
ncbi:MAG: undecaprenyl-diphosphate phosphatase [archaeon]